MTLAIINLSGDTYVIRGGKVLLEESFRTVSGFCGLQFTRAHSNCHIQVSHIQVPIIIEIAISGCPSFHRLNSYYYFNPEWAVKA